MGPPAIPSCSSLIQHFQDGECRISLGMCASLTQNPWHSWRIQKPVLDPEVATVFPNRDPKKAQRGSPSRGSEGFGKGSEVLENGMLHVQGIWMGLLCQRESLDGILGKNSSLGRSFAPSQPGIPSPGGWDPAAPSPTLGCGWWQSRWAGPGFPAGAQGHIPAAPVPSAAVPAPVPSLESALGVWDAPQDRGLSLPSPRLPSIPALLTLHAFPWDGIAEFQPLLRFSKSWERGAVLEYGDG